MSRSIVSFSNTSPRLRWLALGWLALGWTALGSVGFALALLGCAAPGAHEENNRSEGGKYDGLGSDAEAYRQFREGLRCEQDTGACIVEGDIALWDEQEIQKYFYESQRLSATGLTVMQVDAEDSTWDKIDRYDLSYCVSDSFAERKSEVLEAVQSAAAEWMAIGDLQFVYRADEDADCDRFNPRVLFTVTTSDPWSFYYARAFFPNYEMNRRQLRVNFDSLDAADKEEMTLTGIMRHELGHVLGFRHEHVRPESNAPECWENDDWRPLTDYDARSVMHYPHCNGEADWSLELTRTDKNGAALFYPKLDQRLPTRCGEDELVDGNVARDCELVTTQILDFVDTASEEVLDDWARLDTRAVAAIVTARQERKIRSLDELAELPYVAETALRKIYDYLFLNGRCSQELDAMGRVDLSCTPVTNRIVELANEASFVELDEAVRLDVRAAGNLIAIRKNYEFTSVPQLMEVDWVKTRALRKMYDYLFAPSPSQP